MTFISDGSLNYTSANSMVYASCLKEIINHFFSTPALSTVNDFLSMYSVLRNLKQSFVLPIKRAKVNWNFDSWSMIELFLSAAIDEKAQEINWREM